MLQPDVSRYFLGINKILEGFAAELQADFTDAEKRDTWIKRNLDIVTKILDNGGINVGCPCTDSKDDTCWLLRNLTPWNSILHFVDLEVIEERPGKLTLRSVPVEVLLSFSTGAIIQAALAVCLLLARHRCIERVHLVSDIVTRKYPLPLARSLCLSSGLHHLKISSSTAREDFGNELSAAINNMPALESLELQKVQLSRGAAGNIADMVQRNRERLTGACFMENEMNKEATAALLRSLTYSTVLETLCIDDTQLDDRTAEILSRFVSNSQTIRELSVRYIATLDDELFMTIVRSLKRNVTLQTIKFAGGTFTIKATQFLAGVLKQNKSLQFLHIVDCNLGQQHGEGANRKPKRRYRNKVNCELEQQHREVVSCKLGKQHGEILANILEDNETLLEIHLQGNCLGNEGAEALARGIEQNRSLRVLQLGSNEIDVCGIGCLARALVCNRTLQKLVLGQLDCNCKRQSCDNVRLAQLLHITQTLDRMELSYNVLVFEELVFTLQTSRHLLTEIHIDSSLELECRHLQELFRALADKESLETIVVEASVPIDEPTAARVSRFLSKSHSVKCFHLNTTSTEEAAFPILAGGLMRNNSVEKVDMEYCAQNIRSALAFFDLLKKNSRISYFSYLKMTLRYLNMLPEEMDSNYALTTLKVYEESDFKWVLRKVYEKLRRNVSLITRAVQFALDPRADRRMAEAFEVLCEANYLQRRLKDVHGMSEGEVATVVRSARAFIIEHYLPITRIVRRRLVCHPSTRRTQIDKLDYYTWLRIFSYLKVRDVRDQ